MTLGLPKLATTLLGTQAADILGRRAFRSDVRVVALHDVPDARRLDELLRHLGRHYRVLRQSEVLGAVAGSAGTDRPAVWLTFDDGHPSVFEVALPLLQEHGMTATAFVCPSVIGTCEPLWFQLVLGCAAEGLDWTWRDHRLDLDVDAVIRGLKGLPDDQRRQECDQLADHAARHGCPAIELRQATLSQLRGWTDAGNTIGNHSWDHPLLSRCDDRSVEHQLRTTDAWLREHGVWSGSFAYPDGAWNPVAEGLLTDLGVSTALGFDHSTVRRRSNPLRLSRLMLDADADLHRARAITSGWHSRVFGAVRRQSSDRTMP